MSRMPTRNLRDGPVQVTLERTVTLSQAGQTTQERTQAAPA